MLSQQSHFSEELLSEPTEASSEDYTSTESFLNKLYKIKIQLERNPQYNEFYKPYGFNNQELADSLMIAAKCFQKILARTKQGYVKQITVDRLCESALQFIEQLLDQKNCKNPKERAIALLEIETKFNGGIKNFGNLLDQIQQKSIVNSPKQQFREVWQHVKIMQPRTKQNINKKYQYVRKILTLALTATTMEQHTSSAFGKRLLFGLSFPLYMWDYSTARMKCLKHYKNPDINIARKLWNLPQTSINKSIIELSFQKIAFNQMIYIPYQDMEQNEFPDIYTPRKDAISVRILNHKQIKLKNHPKGTNCCSLTPFSWLWRQKQQKIQTIILHIHGGGFIALSSHSVQPITRKWAKQLKVPIFSVNYRKPPKHPFPQATQDCFTVYKFLLDKISYYMNITPKNIYISGDSAGGNLACSVTGKILKQKKQIPKGLYLIYPTLDIRQRFNASKVNCLNDPLLWPSTLNMILKEYLGGKLELQSDPLVSPLLLTEAYVGGDPNDNKFPHKWPKTFINSGQKDAFYEDSLILMQKMKQSNVECFFRVYSEFYHGYLNMIPLMKQFQLALDDSVEDLRRLISDSEQKLVEKQKTQKLIKKKNP